MQLSKQLEQGDVINVDDLDFPFESKLKKRSKLIKKKKLKTKVPLLSEDLPKSPLTEPPKSKKIQPLQDEKGPDTMSSMTKLHRNGEMGKTTREIHSKTQSY